MLIIAEMIHMFKIEKLNDQDCKKPTNNNNNAIINIERISTLFDLITKFFL